MCHRSQSWLVDQIPGIELLEARIAPATINLATPGAAPITFFGADPMDFSGGPVSSAGDVNGDGFDDYLIAAFRADAEGNARSYAGETYLVFGRRTAPAEVELANLGPAGITIFGAEADDYSGWSVSGAGDVNGDGFDDLLIGARLGDAAGNGRFDAGETYLIFGGASLPATIDLASLGAGSVTIFGAESGDQSGASVSSAGDVNRDGFDDFLIGAISADAAGNMKNEAGESYLIFGGAALPATIDLANLGAAGVTILGADAVDLSGQSVNEAGDLNGDGFADFIIGAYRADAAGNAKAEAGESYVIFGGPSLPAIIDLGSLGAIGVTIYGADASDESGGPVSSAGDVNGDGFDDLIIGAARADAAGNGKVDAGESYVIYGGTSLPITIDLSSLGPAGVTIYGVNKGDSSGVAATGAGDVNGDGFDDLLIGARDGDGVGNGKEQAGESYLIFGGANLAAAIDLGRLGVAGITIFGADAGDYSGTILSGAGDVNGDGFDDLLIGAFGASAAGNAPDKAGESYVIFGSAKWRVSPNATTVVEPDGDVVTISLIGGRISSNDIVRGADGSIAVIDLRRFAERVEQTGKPLDLVIKVQPAAGGGSDGVADVGLINGEGVDLGKVKLRGNLGQLIAGSDDGDRALRFLAVRSLGTTDPVAEPLVSEIAGNAGTIKVRGDVRGAAIVTAGSVNVLRIGGNLLGDPAAGAPVAPAGDAAGELFPGDEEGDPVPVGGGIPFGAMSATGYKEFSVEGFMQGASVSSTGRTANVNVGSAQHSTITAGSVGNVTVNGDFIGGGVVSETEIKVVKIFGKLVSNDPAEPVLITAQARPAEADDDTPPRFAIDRLFVRGDVENALILLGYKQMPEPTDPEASVVYVPTNPDASVREVFVRGDWKASSLAVGVLDAGADGFGRNDTAIDAGEDTAVLSRIARLIIKGTATGSAAAGDHFGIVAEKISFAKIDGLKQALTKEFREDLLLDPVNNDFRLVELAGIAAPARGT